jgi:hypothetical protein
MLDTSRFFQLLSGSGGRTRVSIDAAWRVFQKLYPKLSISTEARGRLAELLANLAQQGNLRVPKGKQGWDHTAKPPLPLWVEIAREKTIDATPGMGQVPWPPELAFAAKLKSRVHQKVLLSIRDWLASGGRKAEMVPLKERSAEIFGDEKRLDKLLKTDLFAQGALTLETMRCYPVYPDLIWEAAGAAAPAILIVENSNTYHSFCQWNAKSKHYAACVYGNGFMIHHMCEGLLKVIQETNPQAEIHYFGDLDAAGIRIATELSRLTSQQGLPVVVPALQWYEVLLDQFELVQSKLRKVSPGAWTEKSLEWFSPSVRVRIATVFKKGFRVPQELVGTGWFQGRT